MPASTSTGLTMILALAFVVLPGCVANSSNPTVSIETASMSGESASLTLKISNPGGRRLTINSIEYELSHGTIGYPLASGVWTDAVELPAGGSTGVDLVIAFEMAPIEEDSTLLHLNGQLLHKDHTGFLGLDSMDLGQTAFQLEIEASAEVGAP